MSAVAVDPVVVAAALAAIGHDARFSEVSERLGLGPKPTNVLLMAARDAGLVAQLGTPGRRNARWSITDRGAAALGDAIDDLPETPPPGTRETILSLIEQNPGLHLDSRQMARALAIADRERFGRLGTHSLHHQLHAMAKAGLIEIDVVRDGTAQAIQNIRLPKSRPARETREELTETAAPDGADDPVVWPILSGLRARIAEQAEARAHADALTRAADVLEAIDPDEAARLLIRAETITDGLALSATETEYLAYAEQQEQVVIPEMAVPRDELDLTEGSVVLVESWLACLVLVGSALAAGVLAVALARRIVRWT